MKIRIYDGANTIGGNKIYVGDESYGVFLDFGLNFSEYGKYFKEFITIRAGRGIHDFLEMNLVPNENIYREDIYPKDLRRGHGEAIKVDALLISHAHMDHYGLAGLLDHRIPVVASPETLAIMKAYQDAGKTRLESSVIYYPIREHAESSLPILKSTGNKIRSIEKAEEYLRFRKIIPTENTTDSLKEFMWDMWYDYKTTVAKEKLEFGSIGELPWKVEAHIVDHSIYGSVGYIIHTNSHSIVYTGDLRMHGERGEETWKFINSARNADVLIIEGTRLSTEKEHNYTGEKDVKDTCAQEVEKYKGKLIIADFSARNFERLRIFTEIAEGNGRELVITEGDAHAISGLLSAGTEIETKNIRVYQKPSEKKEWWREIVKNSVVWKDKLVKPKEIRESPGDFIMAFSLYDMPNLMDIKPDGGLYIYSSTEAFNEEMELDFFTLHNWLDKYGIKSAGFRIEHNKPVFEKGYHASGHAAPEDIERIINTINPEIIIPVHTEHREWFTEKYKERVKTGKEIKL